MTSAVQPALLTGRLVTLEPLSPRHAPELVASASDPEVWRWKLVSRPTSVDELRTLIEEAMVTTHRWPFLIRRRRDSVPIGSTTLANFDWRHRCVENGFTWLERASWGQGHNEDTKLLVLTHLFERLELARVEWQADALNERSARAMTRMGFTYEGTARSRHARPDGTRRDSLMFSVIRSEWPDVRLRLHQLLDARASSP